METKSKPIPTSRGVFAERARGVQVVCGRCRKPIATLSGLDPQSTLPHCPRCAARAEPTLPLEGTSATDAGPEES